MLNLKFHKQAIVMTALAILLCLVCLTGATLALFTSNPHDGTIGIIATAGDVEVDIVDPFNNSVSLVGQTLQFQDKSGDTDVLFEPGSIFCTQGFKVKNKGEIPIQFRVSITKDDGENMELFDDAFEVWISTTPSDTPSADMDSLPDFTGYLKSGHCSDDIYYLIVKMKEDADNDFANKTYSGIGITVCAAQGNVYKY